MNWYISCLRNQILGKLMINNNYYYILKSFNRKNYINILYAEFLDEILDFKELAIKEFILIEKQSLNLELSFIVFRSKKVLEEQILKNHQSIKKDNNKNNCTTNNYN